eukprot:TRINITY_DN43902_c0_g1_i1.p1 TRINITY_DN43902_c0_g1~~TRINITY_DN43902_c0_g1_i1.p1  ORF type:complete len:247 (+),score=33.49 TRINITY_DN43902_c0_g1_i1:436-1176(+)
MLEVVHIFLGKKLQDLFQRKIIYLPSSGRTNPFQMDTKCTVGTAQVIFQWQSRCSVPQNYCDVYGNKGAIIKFENGSLNIQQYNAVKHPYHLPNFMDVFSWSIPYVCSKVIEMMISICRKGVADEKEEELKDVPSLDMPRKKEVLRNKVLAMSRMMKMYRVLTENNAVIEELKGLCPDKRIPRGLLMEGAAALRDAVGTYQRAKKWDQINLSLIHISEPTRPLYISYAVFCLKKKKKNTKVLYTEI